MACRQRLSISKSPRYPVNQFGPPPNIPSIELMYHVIPFEPDLAEPVLAFWRNLHPDWKWLDDPETRARAFEAGEAFERTGYVVRCDDNVIASVFGACLRDEGWPRNRYIHIEARPEDIAIDWLGPLLTGFRDADLGRPGTWQIISPPQASQPVLVPLLEAAGFAYRMSSIQMQWEGDSVTVPDPSPAHFERYAGGDPQMDRAICDLHNRAYRPARVTPPARHEDLWKPWPGLQTREYVLALERGSLVGYAEWFVVDGSPPYINSFVAARSHWGTAVGAAVGIKAMEILIELGHRKMESSVLSTNAASMKLHLKHGWRAASEQARTYVRAL
jgi:RimJ/RimL family protein N-acetyltransferase